MSLKRVAMAVFLLVVVIGLLVFVQADIARSKWAMGPTKPILIPAKCLRCRMSSIVRSRSGNRCLSRCTTIQRPFVKQERDSGGTLGQRTEMQMKVQTPFRVTTGDAPKRVFPEIHRTGGQAGRKVIWGEDLYNGKMAVHEVGMLLSLKTIWLDPTGMIAMQGQRYPISEIGMIKLVDKLIERGRQDVDDPDLTITLTEDHDFDAVKTERLQVRRSQPSSSENDFSLAEIVLDPKRKLVLQYRSFGWPEPDDEGPPLLESYTYKDVQMNVGLTDMDFDVKNPDYGYPAF